jgi:hypothetical protein
MICQVKIDKLLEMLLFHYKVTHTHKLARAHTYIHAKRI